MNSVLNNVRYIQKNSKIQEKQITEIISKILKYNSDPPLPRICMSMGDKINHGHGTREVSQWSCNSYEQRVRAQVSSTEKLRNSYDYFTFSSCKYSTCH